MITSRRIPPHLKDESKPLNTKAPSFQTWGGIQKCMYNERWALQTNPKWAARRYAILKELNLPVAVCRTYSDHG